MSLSLEQMKAIARQFTIEPWVNGKLEVLDEVCAPNYRLGNQDLAFLMISSLTSLAIRRPI